MNIQQMLLKLKKDYLADIPSKIEDIKKQFAAKDHEELKNSFHKLKGSGTTYGVQPMSTLCYRLESTYKIQPEKIDEEAMALIFELFKAIQDQQIETDDQLLNHPSYKTLSPYFAE